MCSGACWGAWFSTRSTTRFTPADGEALLSRGIGFTLIGLMVGLFVGIVEQWTKSAWLLMKAGPLAGKQFVVFRNPTVLGSAPKADVYLFKDEAIEPRHALIHDRGGRFEIEDMDTADGTYVNGIPVRGRSSSRAIRSFWARPCSSLHSRNPNDVSLDRDRGVV